MKTEITNSNPPLFVGTENYALISYSHKDKDLVYPDLWELHNREFKFWYDDGIYAGEKWNQEVEEHIKDDFCKLIIFFTSANTLGSEPVRKEMELCKKYQTPYFIINLSEKNLSGLLGAAFESGTIKVCDGAHLYIDFFNEDIINISRLSPTYFESVTKSCLAYGLTANISITNKNPGSILPPISNVPKSPLHNFYSCPSREIIGRRAELSEIKRHLKTDRVVFLHGLGGTGKTRLAQEYIREQKENYTTIVMANYETSLMDMIISDKFFMIDDFGREKAESDENYCHRKLKRIKELSSEKTLFILDNFDTQHDDLLEIFLSGSQKVIITTRNNFDYLGFPIIHIDSLNKDDQLKLFLEHHKKYTKHLPQEDKANIEKILDCLGGHALAIELVAKLMFSKRIPPKNMLRQLEEEGITPHLDGAVNHGFRKATTIYDHIESIFNIDALSLEEMTILLNASLLPLSGMDVDEFIELSEFKDGEKVIDLINRSWIQYDSEKDYLHLHPVISSIVQNKKHLFGQCETFINNLAIKFRSMWSMSKEKKTEYGEFAKNLFSKLPSLHPQSLNIFRWLLYAFQLLDHADLIKKCLLQIKQLWQEENTIEAGWIHYHIADLYLQYQHFDDALAQIKKAIHILKEAHAPSYDIAYTLKHQAHTLHAMFQHKNPNPIILLQARKCLDESEDLFEKALQPPETQFGSPYYSFGLDLTKEHDSQRGSRYYAYAMNHYLDGNYETAIAYALKSFNLFLNINGEIDSDTNAPMRVLSMAYSKTKEFAEAIEMQKRVIYARGVMWGTNQFRYFEQLEVLADIYFESGKKEEGLASLYNLLSLMEDDTLYPFYREKIKNKIKENLNASL